MKHSRLFSPSGASGWVNCNGKHRMVTLLREAGYTLDDKEYGPERADTGRKAHLCAEKLARGEDVSEYEPEMIEHVRSYAEGMSMQRHWGLETKVDFSGFIGQAGGFGTCDGWVIHWEDATLEVRDLKYGYVEVEAYMNEQLMLYALGLISLFELMGRIDYFKLSIWQPRIKNFSTWTCDFETLYDFSVKATVAAKRVKASLSARTYDELKPFLSAGAKQCSYCPCAPLCPTAIDAATNTINKLKEMEL